MQLVATRLQDYLPVWDLSGWGLHVLYAQMRRDGTNVFWRGSKSWWAVCFIELIDFGWDKTSCRAMQYIGVPNPGTQENQNSNLGPSWGPIWQYLLQKSCITNYSYINAEHLFQIVFYVAFRTNIMYQIKKEKINFRKTLLISYALHSINNFSFIIS